LLFKSEQPAIEKLQKVPACGLRRDTGLRRKFSCSQGLSAHKRSHHVGTGWIADQCCSKGNIWSVSHELRLAPNALKCFGLRRNIYQMRCARPSKVSSKLEGSDETNPDHGFRSFYRRHIDGGCQ